jgi:hypothetical protein
MDVERPDELVGLLDLLHRRPAIHRELVHPGRHLLLEAANALHEELVEDRARDREELHPLEQRGSAVLRLVQNTFNEGQPGQLPIEVVLGRVQIDVGGGWLLLLLRNAGRRMPVGG